MAGLISPSPLLLASRRAAFAPLLRRPVYEARTEAIFTVRRGRRQDLSISPSIPPSPSPVANSSHRLSSPVPAPLRAVYARASSASAASAPSPAGARSAASATPATPIPAPVPVVLTIAGSDSGGGAGIQADIKASAAHGTWCATAITAVTAQNTRGVQSVHGVDADVVVAQLRSVLSDLPVAAIKTGMLPNAEVVAAVCDVMEGEAKGVPLVVDPVLVASSGDSLADNQALQLIRSRLLPLAAVVTPNLKEAEALLLLAPGSIRTIEDMQRAAKGIHALGARSVLVKGGHLEGDAATDVFYDGAAFHELSSPRLATTNTHGTGCSMAASIAAELVQGRGVKEAVVEAKAYLSHILAKSVPITMGSGPQGPLNHLPLSCHFGLPNARAAFRPGMLRLYAVTDSRMNKTWGRSVGDAIREAIAGGATFLQIREKDIETGDFVQQAAEAVAVARAHGIPLVINDRVDVALAVDADGIHVGQSDMDAATVRQILGPTRIIGVSCKSPAHAEKAWRDGADYIGVGGVFPTKTKENNRTIGVAGLADVCLVSKLPVVAIGGISGGNIADVVEGVAEAASKAAQAGESSGESSGGSGGVWGKSACGALGGVAVVSAIFNQADIVVATKGLVQALDAAEDGTLLCK
ncbi:hypothetical protein CLOM_g21371 [Closterium sp. NIES-68]|nr:hypothetical protein CLOM_g21371 [Closterium sp. NIES-68]GJP75346.1 hypothetical protein CLOP_g5794 [Closterium sp. NIES-67]